MRKGNPEVIIAVVDTGFDYTHEDLASQTWVNVDEIPDNGIDDDNNGYIDDVHGWDFFHRCQAAMETKTPKTAIMIQSMSPATGHTLLE